jgi:hypothetical protein
MAKCMAEKRTERRRKGLWSGVIAIAGVRRRVGTAAKHGGVGAAEAACATHHCMLVWSTPKG